MAPLFKCSRCSANTRLKIDVDAITGMQVLATKLVETANHENQDVHDISIV
jgi:hypothetical protein